jgi:PTS system mannose-specific IID component
LKFRTLAEVALKSLFLEASWNHQGQQNLGLAAAIDPALKDIYGPGEGLRQARLRALDFFNTNPMTAGLAIGVIINLEGEVAAGRLAAEQRVRMASGLSRTLAAMGDALFWQSWLPLCSLAAVWTVLSLGAWWAPWLLPALFCLPVLPLRVAGLCLGYRRGLGVADLLYRLKVQKLAQGVRRLVALLVGASTVILVYTKTALASEPALGRLWAAVGLVAVTVLVFRFLSGKTRALAYWYPILLVAVATVVLAALDRMQ